MDSEHTTEHTRVAIIGSGFGGLGAAARLRRAGVTDFMVLERAADIGGTWRDNTYPGCACDIPSHLYSFSFAGNPAWPRVFAAQPDIHRYLRDVVERHGLAKHIRLHAEVQQARWDAAARLWRLDTAQGPLTAQVLVSATGLLSEPVQPQVPGLADFPGAVFHTARWDASVDLRGMRVAVVGTGASAAQVVPAVQPLASRLTVVQRTPAWVLPKLDRATREWERRLHRAVPATLRLRRGTLWAAQELQAGAVLRPRRHSLTRRMALSHLRRQVADPALRAQLTPDYAAGCKRVLLSNDFYPALGRPNTEVVSSALAEVRGDRLVMADGIERATDVVVLATGFRVDAPPIAERIIGADGVSLAERWRRGRAALRGCSVDGFPNLLLVVGPNAAPAISSMVLMIEASLEYLVDYLRTLDAADTPALDARPQAVAQWTERVQRRMAGTVWTGGGCASWYLDTEGHNTVQWPGTVTSFRRATRRVRPGEYRAV